MILLHTKKKKNTEEKRTKSLNVIRPVSLQEKRNVVNNWTLRSLFLTSRELIYTLFVYGKFPRSNFFSTTQYMSVEQILCCFKRFSSLLEEYHNTMEFYAKHPESLPQDIRTDFHRPLSEKQLVSAHSSFFILLNGQDHHSRKDSFFYSLCQLFDSVDDNHNPDVYSGYQFLSLAEYSLYRMISSFAISQIEGYLSRI